MKLFVCTNGKNHNFISVPKLLEEAGVIVFSNQTAKPSGDQLSFQQLDGLVIDGASDNNEAGYISALAISQKRPILYLLPKGAILPTELDYLRNNKEVAKYLLVKFYDQNNLSQRLSEFIDSLEHGKGDWDSPTIKFTWRITPRIERYLRWRTNNTGKSKADWLRAYIEDELIQKDQEYKDFLGSL
ncbi:MAG: hypothetical protein ACKKL5_01645 [Candidatus Komeilibacteria bacterium]